MIPPSSLVISSGMGADRSFTARNLLTRPPIGTPRRASSQGEGLLVFPTSPSGEQPDCPSLRASREHIPIVRPRRARRMIWLLPSHPSEAARCARTGNHLFCPHILPLSSPAFSLREWHPCWSHCGRRASTF